MGRLIQKELSGKWQVNGIPWEELQEGRVITKETQILLYGCLCKLKDYEDSGMEPYQAGDLKYEAENMVEHVCSDLCRYRQEMSDRVKLNAVCMGCPVNAGMMHIAGVV